MKGSRKIDEERRKFLKLLAVGSAGLFLGSIFRDGFGGFAEETQFKNFKLVETGKDLKLYTASGDEIVTFEKD